MLVDVSQALGRLSIWCSRVECCRKANLRQGLGVLLSTLDGSLTFFLLISFSVHVCGILRFYFPVPQLLLYMFLTSVAYLRFSSPLAVLIHLSCFSHLFSSKYYTFFLLLLLTYFNHHFELNHINAIQLDPVSYLF